MILGRLFTFLFDAGVAVVATSNVAPDDLYADGINRDHFLPFIRLLKERCDVLTLDGPTDYRLEKIGGEDVWRTPLGPEADRALDGFFRRLAAGETARPVELTVKGRRVRVPAAASGVARFDFLDLCGAPLGARDYRAIVDTYGTLVIDRIPVFTPERRNQAKRFIILVDTLYDSGAKLVASAEAEPQALDQGLTKTEGFEFQRTVSRLIEMRSAAYLAAPRRQTASEPA
jgi:cell division protein ZapE